MVFFWHHFLRALAVVIHEKMLKFLHIFEEHTSNVRAPRKKCQNNLNFREKSVILIKKQPSLVSAATLNISAILKLIF
jgi:hypothetical protein